MNETLFIVCVAVICALALALIIWIIAALVKMNKKGEKGRTVIVDGTEYELVPIGEAPVVVREAPAAAPAAAEPQERAETEPEGETETAAADGAVTYTVEEGEDVVLLKRNEAVPYAEAYENLTAEQKGFVDDILAHAESKEGVKKIVNDKSASVYLGKKLVVRILLKRGFVYARLTVQNNNFAAYTDNAGLNIKEKPIDVKVETAEMANSVKDIIDLSYGDFLAERERKDEEKRAQRREKRRLAREKQLAEQEEAPAGENDAPLEENGEE